MFAALAFGSHKTWDCSSPLQIYWSPTSISPSSRIRDDGSCHVLRAESILCLSRSSLKSLISECNKPRAEIPEIAKIQIIKPSTVLCKWDTQNNFEILHYPHSCQPVPALAIVFSIIGSYPLVPTGIVNCFLASLLQLKPSRCVLSFHRVHALLQLAVFNVSCRVFW